LSEYEPDRVIGQAGDKSHAALDVTVVVPRSGPEPAPRDTVTEVVLSFFLQVVVLVLEIENR